MALNDDGEVNGMTTREKILLVPLCAVLLVVALSWRLWLIALGFAVAVAAVVWLETRKGPIVRGIRTVLRHRSRCWRSRLVTVAMFSARAAMWISACYRGAVKAEAEL